MRTAELLELEELWLLEPTYAELVEERYSALLLELGGSDARLLLDEHGDPIALAVKHGGHWIACSFLHRRCPPEVIEFFEETGGELHQVRRREWLEAVREQYSLEIARQITPTMEDVTERRLESLTALLEKCWGHGGGAEAIDACCGSGIGTLALREVGYQPVSYDNDLSLLSLGLSRGRLEPSRAVCIDGTKAREYIDAAPFGAIFMAGEVNEFTLGLWHALVAEMLSLAENALVTVGTEKEALIVKGWFEETGRKAELREHDADPFYDHWVCLAHQLSTVAGRSG